MATMATGYGTIEMPDADYEAAQQRKRDAEAAMTRPASDRIMDTQFDPERVAARARPFMGQTNEQRTKSAQDLVAAGMGSERDYRTAAGSMFAGVTAEGQDTVPAPTMQEDRATAMNARTQQDLRRESDLQAALEQSREVQDQNRDARQGAIIQEAVKTGQLRPKLDESGQAIAGAFEGIKPERKPIMPGTDGDMILDPATGKYEFRARQLQQKQEQELKPAPGGAPVVQKNGFYGTWDPKLGQYTNWKPIEAGADYSQMSSPTMRDTAIMLGKGRGMDASKVPQWDEVVAGQQAGGAGAQAPAPGNVATPQTQQERDALPEGTSYRDPVSGKIFIKHAFVTLSR